MHSSRRLCNSRYDQFVNWHERGTCASEQTLAITVYIQACMHARRQRPNTSLPAHREEGVDSHQLTERPQNDGKSHVKGSYDPGNYCAWRDCNYNSRKLSQARKSPWYLVATAVVSPNAPSCVTTCRAKRALPDLAVTSCGFCGTKKARRCAPSHHKRWCKSRPDQTIVVL